MKKNLYYIILFFEVILAVSSISCKKYLDVNDDFSASDSKGFIFAAGTPEQIRRFHGYIYYAMPDYSDYANPSKGGLGNPWASMSDEMSNNGNSVLRNLVVQGYTSSTAGGNTFHRWTTLYKVIRQATIFIDSVRTGGAVGDPDFMDSTEVKLLKSQAYFFRAYAHYLLLEQYGPVTVMHIEADPTDPTPRYERNSVDEVADAIEKDLDAAMPNLEDNHFSSSFPSGFDENRLAIPTKGVAKAVRAKLRVLIASPLLNGGYTEALSLTNKDGKKLFPAYDANKWVKAKQALEEFLTYANDGNYELYRSTSNNPNLNIYELFQKYNKEIIWANPLHSWPSVEFAQTPRDITATAGGGAGGNLGPTQEMVDAFFMNNGLKINDPASGYSENGLTIVKNPVNSFVKNGVQVVISDTNVSKMYADREPRFYAAVTYQRKSWHDVLSNPSLQTNSPNTSKATRVVFTRDIASSKNPLPGYGGIANNDNSTGGYTLTGYLTYKNSNRTIHPTLNGGVRNVYRPSIIFRLADFYLLYAEVLNEINPQDPNIIKYIDMVRTRAGIPGYLQMHANSTKTNVIGNQAEQRKAIIAERRVELFTEGQRYFDVRRWMIADKEEGRQGGIFHGMNMNGHESNMAFYQRVDYYNSPRKFEKAMYLYPIPLNEIVISNGSLVQNPGW